MSIQELSTQSNPATVPCMDEPERFMHDANTGRKFVSVARGELSAPTTHEIATSVPQSFTEALRALNDSNGHPQQETSMFDLAHGSISKPLNTSFRHKVQRIIASKVDRGMEERFKTEHAQATKEALTDVLATGHVAKANGPKHAFNNYNENLLIEMALRATLNCPFIKNLELRGQTPEFLDASTQRSPISRTFTNSLATLVKQRMNYRMVEWLLSAKEGTQPEKIHLVAFPSLPSTPLSKEPRNLARRKFERVHARKQSAKSQKVKKDKYVPPFFTSSRLSKTSSPTLTRRQIATIGANINFKNRTTYWNHTFRYTKLSSLNMYVPSVTAHTV